MNAPFIQIVTVGALSYALYTAVTCPCEVYLSCHIKQFYSAVGVASVAAYLAQT